LTECLANCPQPTPKPQTCEGACKERAAAVLKACLDSGVGADECEQRSKAAFTECMTNCPQPTPKPEGCEDKCRRVADAALQACKAAGGNAEECAQKARAAFTECLQQNCPQPTAQPTPACESRCNAVAEEARKACRANGGTEADCAQKARNTFSECMVRCDPKLCANSCQEKAAAVRTACLANGGSEETCAEEARKALSDCMAGCPSNTSPRPNP
jgi:hypothetical protein